MGLFGFAKKKKEEINESCCKGAAVNETANECCCKSAAVEEASSESKYVVASDDSCTSGENGCHIKVLGAGCKSCHEQYENVKKALADMNLDADVEYITDMEKLMSYGVMSMPAIVVNGQVVSMGKVLKAVQVEKLLKELSC